MKTLVTGATGFAGKYLVKRLIAEQKNVSCLVRPQSNCAHLKELGVELVYGDLADCNTLGSLKKDKFDIIYHLAGAVYSTKNIEFKRVNITGTSNLLHSCYWSGLQKFIYLSSIAVNGFPAPGSLITEDTPCIPFTPYGKTKLQAEKLIANFFADTHVCTIFLRAPVIYGPDGQADLVTEKFKRIAQGKVLIVGDGSNMRSLCYIDNLIEGLILAEKNAEMKNNIYVISDSQPYSFRQLVAAISDVLNTSPRLFYLPSCIADFARYFLFVMNTFGSYSWKLYSIATMNIDLGCLITKAEREIGYRPKIDLKTGIKKTLGYYLNN